MMMSDRPKTLPLPEGKKVVISANPKSGPRSGRPLVDALCAALNATGFEAEVATDIDYVANRSNELHAAGQLRCVVAAGGDGTVALVANRTNPGVPVAVLPLGTENLLARYLEITASAAAVRDLIESGVVVRLDAGKADDRIFLLMVSCGFDAEVVRRLHTERSGHIHHLSYAKPIIDSIRTYQYPLVSVCAGEPSAEKNETTTTARWVFVANLPRYAGGLAIVPDADGTDGLLDVCTFREGSLFSGLVYLAGVVFGQHSSWEGCDTNRVKHVRISSDTPDVPYQLDGDFGGFLPVEIEILPQRLTLLTPPPWAKRHGFA